MWGDNRTYNIDCYGSFFAWKGGQYLDHIFLTKIFDCNRSIVECQAFQERVLLHQLYRWCISIVLMSITIPLMFISFSYFIVKTAVIFVILVALVIGCCIFNVKMQKKQRPPMSFFDRLMYGGGILLIAPLFILCQIGSATSRHVTHFFRFHRYVGSSNKRSGVLFYADACMCTRWSDYLSNMMKKWMI